MTTLTLSFCSVLIYGLTSVFCGDDNVEKLMQARDKTECRFEFDELPQARVVHSLMEQLRANNYEGLDAYLFTGIDAQYMTLDPKSCERLPLRHDDDNVGSAKHLVVRRLLNWLSKLHRPFLNRKPKMCSTATPWTPTVVRSRVANKTNICQAENIAACIRRRVWDNKSQNFYVKGRLGAVSKPDCVVGTGLLTIGLLSELHQFAKRNSDNADLLVKRRVARLNERFKDLFAFLLPELLYCLPATLLEQLAHMHKMVEVLRIGVINLKYWYHVKHFQQVDEYDFNHSTLVKCTQNVALKCVDEKMNPIGPTVFHNIASKLLNHCFGATLTANPTLNSLNAIKQKIAKDPNDLRNEVEHINLDCVVLAKVMKAFVMFIDLPRRMGRTLKVYKFNDDNPTSVIISAMSNENTFHLCEKSIIFKYIDTLSQLTRNMRDNNEKKAIVTHYLNIIKFETSSDKYTVEDFKFGLLHKYNDESVSEYLRSEYTDCLRDKLRCASRYISTQNLPIDVDKWKQERGILSSDSDDDDDSLDVAAENRGDVSDLDEVQTPRDSMSLPPPPSPLSSPNAMATATRKDVRDLDELQTHRAGTSMSPPP